MHCSSASTLGQPASVRYEVERKKYFDCCTCTFIECDVNGIKCNTFVVGDIIIWGDCVGGAVIECDGWNVCRTLSAAATAPVTVRRSHLQIANSEGQQPGECDCGDGGVGCVNVTGLAVVCDNIETWCGLGKVHKVDGNCTQPRTNAQPRPCDQVCSAKRIAIA